MKYIKKFKFLSTKKFFLNFSFEEYLDNSKESTSQLDEFKKNSLKKLFKIISS